MFRRLVAALVLPAAFAAAAEPPAKPDPPRRIASLNLAADEILVELVPADRLVTATVFADDPGVSNVVGRIPPSITRITRAKLENVVAARPDLVVVSEFSDADFMHMLTMSGLRYHRIAGHDSFEGIRRGILELAAAVGEPEKGQALAERLDASLRETERLVAKVERPRVLPWNDPHAFGTGTLLGTLVERAGGRNVGAEMGVSGVRPIGTERALAADPDYFLVAEGGDRGVLLAHPVLSKSRAVKAGRIVEVPGPLLTTLSHHAARTCRFLAHALHPAAVPKPE